VSIPLATATPKDATREITATVIEATSTMVNAVEISTWYQNAYATHWASCKLYEDVSHLSRIDLPLKDHTIPVSALARGWCSAAFHDMMRPSHRRTVQNTVDFFANLICCSDFTFLQNIQLPSSQDKLDESRRRLLQYSSLRRRVPNNLGILERQMTDLKGGKF
jgi:hypothetical protein